MTTDDNAMAMYRQHLARVRRALADAGTWAELPHLLDELERARSGTLSLRHDAEEAWVDSFIAALPATDARGASNRAEQTARELWPWLGRCDPQALAAGRWDQLPRSHA